METTLSKDVQEKLDMINWDSLKDKYGISRDTFYNNPHLAKIQGGDFGPTEWFGERTESVFNSVSLNSIKESIGRYCLDEGIGICDANRTSNVETANKDVANSKDSKLIVLYWIRGDYGRSY